VDPRRPRFDTLKIYHNSLECQYTASPALKLDLSLNSYVEYRMNQRICCRFELDFKKGTREYNKLMLLFLFLFKSYHQYMPNGIKLLYLAFYLLSHPPKSTAPFHIFRKLNQNKSLKNDIKYIYKNN